VAKQNKINKLGQLRIIAGKFRGRKLNFPDVDGLRPTPDRVRETVFNWLQADIGSARCLDLFAGSGALGFEAVSRGAAKVTMVELDRQAARQLTENSQLLNAEQCQIEKKTAQQFLSTNHEQYDIVFIDPPYKANLWTEISTQLMSTKCMAENAVIYMECPRKADIPDLPKQWQLEKDKTAGGIRYCLFRINHRDTE